ncbi:MAG: hypothetical protein H6618_03415 [Deltaproteobacteria bacterium]|nr:hypothetical protein [Deltaproteobacteria bacterium]
MISVADSGLLSGFTRATNMLSDLIRSLSDSSPAAMRYTTLGIGAVTAAATGAVVLGGVSQLVTTALSGIATGLTAGTVFTMLAGGGAFVAAGLGIASYASWWYDQNRKEIEELSDEFGAWLKKKVAEEQGMEQALWEGLVSLWEFRFPSFRDVRDYAAELAESSGLSVLSGLIKEDVSYRPDPSFHLNLPMKDPGVSPDYVSPMKEQQGFIWNPIRDRRYFQLEYQPKKLQLFAPDTAKKEEKKEISLLFRFDEMPDFMKSPEITAPHELRIHKEVRRSFKGLYG